VCSTFARTYCLGSRVESLPHEDFDVAPLHRCTWWILQRCSKFVLDHSSWILGRLTSDTMDHLSLQPQPKRSCDPAPSISTQALSWTKNKDKLNLVYIKVSWLKKKRIKVASLSLGPHDRISSNTCDTSPQYQQQHRLMALVCQCPQVTSVILFQSLSSPLLTLQEHAGYITMIIYI
jgi:hypothetical protein